MNIPRTLALMGALCAVPAAIGVSFAASAESAPEEIIVTGNYGRVPDSVESLSQRVSYADLDLSKDVDRDILRQRIKLTARFLCDKLGESPTATPPAPSCRDAATSDAMSRVGSLEASFAPRGTTWVAGPAWQAPYPIDWATKYPK